MAEQMTMTNVYTEGFVPFIEQREGHEPVWMTKLRRAAHARFVELGFPTLRHEDWRNTNVKPISEGDFVPAEFLVDPDASRVHAISIPKMAGHRLVFINGHYSASLSCIGELPKGVRVVALSEALAAKDELLQSHFGKYADFENHAFIALNYAFVSDGAFLFFPPNSTTEEPIQIVFVSTGAGKSASYTHNLIVAGENSEAKIVLNHVSLDVKDAFTNGVLEVAVDSNARIDLYDLQREAETVHHYEAMAIHQKEASVFRAHTITLGGGITRNDVIAKLDGKGAEGIVNGLYVLDGTQHVDTWMWIEHIKENIPSHELYKGVLDGNSSAAFSGRIYVHREAQKTDAKQTNQNILLSRTARAFARPQLEIYADDVKCTHGATVGQLDPMALFYLRSRGLPADEARRILIQAFASDITERIRIPEVFEVVREELMAKLTKG